MIIHHSLLLLAALASIGGDVALGDAAQHRQLRDLPKGPITRLPTRLPTSKPTVVAADELADTTSDGDESLKENAPAASTSTETETEGGDRMDSLLALKVTRQPTQFQSASSTVGKAAPPSASPVSTDAPSASSVESTDEPSALPVIFTDSPNSTIQATIEVTPPPSERESMNPSQSPSLVPSKAITASPITSSPSKAITASPVSSSPTGFPSEVPILAHSELPSQAISMKPSQQTASELPSQPVSEQPSQTISSQPSETISEIPSLTISSHPSQTSSSHPSNAPSLPSDINLGGKVFNDANSNGIFDSDEEGVSDIHIEAYSCNGAKLVARGTSKSNGSFMYIGEPGCYYFTVKQSEEYSFTINGLDSTVNPENGRTPDIVREAGEVDLSWNVGIVFASSSSPVAAPRSLSPSDTMSYPPSISTVPTESVSESPSVSSVPSAVESASPSISTVPTVTVSVSPSVSNGPSFTASNMPSVSLSPTNVVSYR